MAMDFGFTNEVGKYNAVVSFRDAAIADGWIAKPTYGDHEPMGTAASLTKDGFKMSCLSRTKAIGKWKYEASVCIWGPDGLVIAGMPMEYNWDEIKMGLKRCNYCLRNGVETLRVGFAGRCCKECLPEKRKQLEFPGWTR